MTRREAPVSPPVVLTIAGSDSGGGAGIQADVKTVEACGGFGTTAITSVTAQNTQGVAGSHGLPIEDVETQIEAVTTDFDVAAVKTGMLATSDVIDLVVEHAPDLPNLVVDPVMVAASGDRLLAEAAEDAYDSLVAAATLVTPNADEAAVLTGVTVDDVDAAERAGRILVEEQGADAALVKGGHVPGDQVVDTLVTGPTVGGDRSTRADDVTVTTFRHDRVVTDATHGSGCTLSSAIATHLAHGEDLVTAVGAGVDLLARAVRYNVDVGQGPGAVHHLVALRNDASRQPTADLLRALAAGCRDAAVKDLVPPDGLALVAATPHAETRGDVATTTVRRPRRGDGDADADDIAVHFDAEPALADALLAARELDPALRFAALVGGDRGSLDALAGTTVAAENAAIGGDDPARTGDRLRGAILTAERPPVAVSTATVRPDGERRPAAILFGQTPDDVRDRLAAIET